MRNFDLTVEHTVDSLTQRQAELLELLLAQQRAEANILQPYPRGETGAGALFPASGSQQRLWFIDRLEGSSTAYNVPFAVRLQGPLDRSALQCALDDLIERHESLRTVFVESEGQPRQQVLPATPFALQVIDARSSDAEHETVVLTHSQAELSVGFDLCRGPLIRARLLQLAPLDHVLLITMHHIICDGWSIGIFIREFGALYDAHRERRPNPLPPLPIQYVDYALWQRDRAASAEMREQLQYWQQHLHGAPELLELPTDHPRPATQSYRGSSLPVSLGGELTQQVKHFARRSNLTLAMVLQAAWTIVLAKLSGQSDIVLGIPVANRRRTEFESLIGLFVNTLATRVQVDEDASIEDVLTRVKDVLLTAYTHQDAPFEQVVEVLQPARSLSYSPIFQVMFVLQNAPREAMSLSGLTLTEREVGLQSAQFDLLLSLQESPTDITGQLTFATDLFEASTITRWVGYFQRVLRAIVEQPGHAVSRISLLSEQERRVVLDTFNATAREYPRHALIHELFEAQVARAPDALAVQFEEQSLTYAQLNARSNQLARHLRALGVSRDCLVGICTERSIEMVVGLLGILKAGGAYVPLDPDYPADRLKYMLDDAEPKVLLTQARLKPLLAQCAAHLVALDTDWHLIEQYSADNMDPADLGMRSSQLAYVIYTSGSTGRPKGAMNEHRALINRLQWMQDEYRLGEHERVLQKTPFSFDVSVWEFFWTLTAGARLIVARPRGHQDAGYLSELIENTGVTTLHFVPSMLQAFLERHRRGRCPSLRHVVCSGEELPSSLQERFFELLPNVRLSNLYGPTEAAIDVTYWACEPNTLATRVPIGRPIANVRMYVLDSHLQPVPVGVAGEIYIGGDGVGRGYWRRPELTAERFVCDPYAPDTASRLYKTGDVGRWRADGAIEYLGRNDHQIKIRGFRIELGEIEAQLSRHPRVREAVVIAREDKPGDKRLIAYVTARDTAPEPESLRVHLKEVLPEHMVPGAFVVLERMPVSPNGKLERRALPAPNRDAYAVGQYEAPQGDTEQILAGIWQDLLQVQQIGRHDHFFELGGHSLLIVQMLERLARLGLSVEVRGVFENPKLLDLARALKCEDSAVSLAPGIPEGCLAITPTMLPMVAFAAEHIEHVLRAVPGGSGNIQDIYPLAPLQEGILFHHLLKARAGDTYVMPLVFEVRSAALAADFVAALQAVVDRHDALRTAILWEQLPHPVQVVYRRARLSVEHVMLDAQQAAHEQLRERLLPQHQWMDLRTAPLLRVQIAEHAGSSECFIILQLHHVVIDHVTLEILLNEALACMAGQAQHLPAPVPYRNHVAQALAYASKPDAERFFGSKLSDIDGPTAPFGIVDVHSDGNDVEELCQALDHALASAIRIQARRLGVTAATLFHAAWALVTARTSGRDDVVFGSVLLGRLHGTHAQRSVGMFINTLPLRLQLAGRDAVGFVQHTHQELTQLLSHELASLSVAQRCSGVHGGVPLFSTLLNFRHSGPSVFDEWARRGVRMLIGQERTNYPIAMAVDDHGSGFSIKAQTDRRLQPARLIEYLATGMQSLLQALQMQSKDEVLSLQIVPAAERQLILQSFNPAVSAYPSNTLITQLFEAQVSRTPEAIALVHASEALTYSELNARANQLARQLRELGIARDRLVGVCVERSPMLIVGLLAVLKAGGAYVPLDPQYPKERLAYIVADAQLEVVLTEQQFVDQLPSHTAQLVVLDDHRQRELEHLPTENLDTHRLSSEQLAYVLYTSGSTGQPKGVMIEHRHVLNLWQELHYLYGDARECQRVALNASFNFDASVQQLTQLLSGRTLYIIPQDVRRDASLMLLFLTVHRIQGLDCTPAQLKSWIAAGLLTQSTALRTVFVGGEAIDADLWRQLAHCASTAFYNVYGPTECTVDATIALIQGDMSAPHIGRPMCNRRVYILDRCGQLQPLGVPGEIYIGGAGIARGYFNRAQLTRERFVPDTFVDDPSARMYKTGDVGAWRTNGTLEYLGRNDQQVKLRGFRIELGEIEAHLRQQGQVTAALVVVREDLAGDKRLIAYVTADSASVPTAQDLRDYLKLRLPEHMVPSAFVVIDRFPLLPNGKLDRRALPAPEADAYASGVYEAPVGEAEQLLAGIWQALLGVDRVGRNDHFFELGGHSLLIVQMMERLRRLGLAIQVRQVFDHPTLRGAASVLTRASAQHVEVPPNQIPLDAAHITPAMLPLIDLDHEHIARIVRTVPQGACNIQDIYPLAPLQEGILFHHLMNEAGPDMYVVPTVFSFDSRQRLDRWTAALQAVIDRHDVLRTAIVWEDLPRPVQVVYRKAALQIEEVAWANDLEVEQAVQGWLQPQLQRLDLHQAPMLRLRVAQAPDGVRWYALLQLHHIVGDATSQDIVLEEIGALLAGRAHELPPPVPYREHVAQSLLSAQAQDAEAFFRSKLGDVTEPTAPFGLIDVHGEGAEVLEARVTLDPQLARRIRSQARQSGVSVATIFHAAWSLVLARTSGRDDVVFGSVLLGRLTGHAGAQRILGMFINTLPLRVQLRDITVAQLIEHTQRELVDLLAHEQSSLAVAQRCSGVSGSTPLFSALFNYRHRTCATPAWSHEEGIAVVASQNRTNYPVTMSVDDSADEFQVLAQTDRRIDPARMAGYLATALQSLIEALDSSPGQLALKVAVLPAREWRTVIEAFNATASPYPRHKLIHELFEEQVARTPEAPAVMCGVQQLTYRQLNRKANQLAHQLRARGVVPDSFVGLCVERGVDMVIGMLGILKAGGAYVPLDPNYPLQRLEFILEDTAPKVILTQAKLQQQLLSQLSCPAPVLALDTSLESAASYADTNPTRAQVRIDACHLAYVIYTSGSTGRPKGVAIEHRNAVNLICWAQTALPKEMFASSLHSTSLNFDLSVYECFVPLSLGGSLQVTQNALSLINEPCEVTLINTVPSAMKALLDAGSVPQATRVVNLAGEPLKKDIVERIFADSRVELVCNLYGPSETTTYSTWVAMPRQQGFDSSIGRPLANTTVYLLDALGEPVPLGAVGEIYIGGEGVARGYLNRPELTAQRFIRDPFSAQPHARMYKTGDLGRWRENGTIEYLGRNDHQVKIRGFRIELGEIEERLACHAQIKEAAVIAQADHLGEPRLIAYIVRSEAPAHERLDADALRAHLKATLPEHMLPSVFVTLERMPLTPNGKLDRRALPAPDLQASLHPEHEPPQGEIEELLASIWEGLLGVQRVGRHDNFFELGGHSLLIVQLKERLRRVGFTVDVRRVFESATLAELASVLKSAASELICVPANRIPTGAALITPDMLTLIELTAQEIQRVVATVPEGAANVQDIYPLAPLQEGILFHHLLTDATDTYVLATVFCLASEQRLQDFINALQVTIDRHDVLRTAVLWEQLPRPVQVVYRRASLSVERFELDETHDPLTQIHARFPPGRQRLDVRRAPLMHLHVALDPSAGQYYAVLQFHHATIDHLTLEAVMTEVMAHMQGAAPRVIESVPYRNHVAQALAYQRSNAAEEFFRRKLADIEEPTAPFGLLEAHGEGGHIEEASHTFDAQLSTRIRGHARRLGVSAATLFHAACALVVAHTSGREEVVFGSLLLGRLQSDADGRRMLGMFINTLPLCLRLRQLSAKQLVEHTQRELVELLNHEQASLATAQRCSGIAGSLPLFSVLLNYRHSSRAAGAGWSTLEGVRVLEGQERTNYPITISIDDFGDEFALKVQTDVRIPPQRIMSYLATAIESLLAALDEASPLEALSLPILPHDEQRQVLETFNSTACSYPSHPLIHQLFEAQVARTPEKTAAVHGEQRLTYAQLNARANCLARFLRSRGVGSDELVGICFERGMDMVIAVLAVLKAGGAYLPLDPTYPAERLRYMIEDAQPRLLLTQTMLRSLLDSGDQPIVALDHEWPRIESYAADSTGAAALSSDSLLYVIYTSGSTGRPKGTAMPHRAMVNLIEWHREQFSVNERTHVLQFAALSFDVAFQEIFTTLCTGATLVLLDEWVRRDARALVELLRRHEVERLFLPPLMLQSVAEHCCSEGVFPTSLRDVITAGEQLRIGPEIVAFFTRLAGCRLHNHYGPTETHVVTALTLDAAPERWPTLPSIGRPIANTQIYVLDRHLRPVPQGVAAEIYIGGANLARGYLRRPEMTKQRFIDDPFSQRPGASLYRTGDLGRWLPDGTLEYRGRNDEQVKIRGYRIELGEIEAQLAQHEDVKDAAVIVREDVPGDKRLVAYVTPRGAHAPEGPKLRSELLKAMPEYAVPSVFVVLEALPLTPSGKLNRRALPVPDLTSEAERRFVAPVGELEVLLASIWQEVLRIERIGRHDNFFELGGHSLHSMKLVGKVQAAVGVRLPVIAVFQHPSIQAMGQAIEALRWNALTELAPSDLEEGVVEFEEDTVPPLAQATGAQQGIAR